jgi:hypothetical protein
MDHIDCCNQTRAEEDDNNKQKKSKRKNGGSGTRTRDLGQTDRGKANEPECARGPCRMRQKKKQQGGMRAPDTFSQRRRTQADTIRYSGQS